MNIRRLSATVFVVLAVVIVSFQVALPLGAPRGAFATPFGAPEGV